ncbi:hypothetical protein KZ844_33700, partial [Pseudomonas aeruginosa]|nr:hypothetical protein [Pseudomonas aeruginosa]
MKGTVHPRRLLLCLVLVPALLAGLGAWQSWRAEQQAERLGAAQKRGCLFYTSPGPPDILRILIAAFFCKKK